jgi:small subunit ribosomal protein S2
MTATISMRDMLEAGVHFGHQTRRWNPKMAPYIYGARDGVHIINLGKTLRLFRDAMHFVSRVVSNGNQVLFVGTKRQAQEVVEEEATRCNMPYVTHRWLGGMLTNHRTIRQSLDRLEIIEKHLAEGSVERLSKKEILHFEKQRNKLRRHLGGIRDMPKVPGVVFIIDPNRERIAVHEAKRLAIPIVALCDTNCDPDDIDYPIPANDDAIRAIKLFASAIAETVLSTDASSTQLVSGFETTVTAEQAEALEAGEAVKSPESDDAPVEVVRRGLKSKKDSDGETDGAEAASAEPTADGEETTVETVKAETAEVAEEAEAVVEADEAAAVDSSPTEEVDAQESTEESVELTDASADTEGEAKEASDDTETVKA